VQKVYTLAIDKPFNLQPLKGFGLMTLLEAEYWRDIARTMGRVCLVVNYKTLKGLSL
jgi:hypothetical protein